MTCPHLRVAKLWVALLIFQLQPLSAYSVQTHEQLIDLTWKSTIKPFMMRRFPKATDAEIEAAHAFAYGGCAIQDLGYYPGGHEFFSDLTHYVRSGDFIAYLFQHAQTPAELAFAIGAMSHYVGDTIGHKIAVNPSVAISFPKLAQRYGSSVAYVQDPHAHIRVEFAFDIDEISKHRMAPSAYLRHVGLKVPSALLARAFEATYGLNFTEVLGPHRPVVRGYRFAVRSFLPRIAYAETVLHRNGFPPDTEDQALRQFEQNLAHADFKNDWEKFRKKAGVRTHLLAWVIFVLPKVGPLSQLAIRGPNADTQHRYLESVNASTDEMRRLLASAGAVSAIPNRDLDTGDRVKPGAYALTDKTYATLLDAVTGKAERPIPSGLKDDLLAYYADPESPISTRQDPVKWARVQKALAVLQQIPTLRSDAAMQGPPSTPPSLSEPRTK